MCEAHLWKIGEKVTFTLKGWSYNITLRDDFSFVLRKNQGEPIYFRTLGRLFHYIFESRMISY